MTPAYCSIWHLGLAQWQVSNCIHDDPQYRDGYDIGYGLGSNFLWIAAAIVVIFLIVRRHDG